MSERKELCGMVDCMNEVGPWSKYVRLCVWCLEMAEWALEEWPRDQERAIKRQTREEQAGTIYMVLVGDRIKVGFSTKPKQRLRQYPPGSTLLAFIYGEGIRLAEERALHERLTQYRVAGREWYADCDGVRAVVAEMVEKYGKPAWQPQWGDGQRRQRNGMAATRRAGVVLDRR